MEPTRARTMYKHRSAWRVTACAFTELKLKHGYRSRRCKQVWLLNASRQKEKHTFGMHFKASNKKKSCKYIWPIISKQKKSFIQYIDEREDGYFLYKDFHVSKLHANSVLSFWELPVSKRDIFTSAEHLNLTASSIKTPEQTVTTSSKPFYSILSQTGRKSGILSGNKNNKTPWSMQTGWKHERGNWLRMFPWGESQTGGGSFKTVPRRHAGSLQNNRGIHSQTLSHCPSTGSSSVISTQLHAKLPKAM